MGSIYKTGLPISPYPDENVQQIKKLTGNSIDIVIRPFILGSGQKAVAFYVDGLIDNDMLGRDFFAQLMNTKKEFCSVDDLADQVLTLGEVTIANSLDEVMEMVLQAMTALFVEG